MATAGKIFLHARSKFEATRGAGGTPDVKIIFDEGSHTQTQATIRPKRLSGSYFGFYSAAAGTETNEFTFSGLADFNQMALWGKLFILGTATGVGAGADKTWTFLPASTTDNLGSLDVEFGVTDALSATQPGWQCNYVVGEEFHLGYTKTPDSPGITFESRLITPKGATQISAYTGTAPEPTLQLASHINTRVFIDTTTLGTTADDNVTAVEWTLNNGFANLYTLNATANAQDTFRPDARTWTASITRYYANDTETDAWVAKTPRKIRLRTTGAVLGGSTYKLDLELYGVYTAREWTEVDGLMLEQFTLEPIYDTGAATDFQMVVVNSLAAI